MTYRVGVDIGGTFTDFCVFHEETKELYTFKVLSRPDEPGAEVMEGLRQLRERFNIEPEGIRYFTHGTTIGVNTVIQRQGIKLCLFTTRNFIDVLEVARLKTPDPYDLDSRRPDPLIPPVHRPVHIPRNLRRNARCRAVGARSPARHKSRTRDH